MASETDLEIFIGANTAQFRESMQKARDDIQIVNEEVRSAAAATEDGADKFTAAQVRATQRLLRSIDPTLRSMDALEVKQRKVEQSLRDGKISTEEYSRAMQILSRDLEQTQAKERLHAAAFGQATAAMQRQDQMLKKMNISVGQYRSAVGMLPAQMTDVVTQLAGGQNPLLILLQQGGQIKDSFGGIKNTFVALSSVISPAALGVVALSGGIGGLAYALYKAEQEQQAFNRNLIMTGSYAGKTTGELQALARAMSGDGLSQGSMASALAQTVGSGAFSGSSVEMVANAAARLEKSTGASIDSTIEQFKRLQQDPVAAVKTLDDQIHFLTAAQLEQITTLASQGREQEAARVAMNAYAAAINTRTAEMRENLGSLEIAWRSVKNTASEAWDSMLNIGREVPISDKLEETRRQLENAKRDLVNLKKGSVNVDTTGYGFGRKSDSLGSQESTQAIIEKQSLVLRLQKQLGELGEKSYQESIKAGREKADRDDQERQKRQIEATEKLNREYESEATRHIRKLEQIRNSGAAKDAIDLAINAENERYAKSQSRGNQGSPQGESLADRYSQRLAQTREALQLEQAGAQTLTQSERDLIALRQRLDDLKGRSLTKTEQSVVANAAILEKLLSQNVAEEKALEQQKALNEMKRKGSQLSMQMEQEAQRDSRTRSFELQGFRMGDLARERARQEMALRDHYDQVMGELERSATQKGTKGSTEYSDAVRMLQESLEQRLQALRGYYAAVDAERARWDIGVSRSMQNIKEAGDDAAGAAGEALTGAFSSAADSLANFVSSGKANFRSLTTSILSDLARIAARMALSKAVGGLFSMFGGAAAGGANAFSSGEYGNLPLVANASGGVYRSPDLSAYSGQVVSQPTFFAFARGAGLMGEAGPEAIMPLTRDSKGRLAVTAVGAGAHGSVFSPNYNVVIQNDGKNGEIGPGALKAVYDLGQKAAADFLRQQGRDGGHLSGAYR
ncbi:phage tail tape measure protein [Edwardsiella piscicida]|uniref:phage tail tape measure protein n=1 Tax=Edwardsiella piscicida TaxID=1263550 RepID=UPI0020C8F7A1|nr:phage tail tape measure protein [Edwardsiella piscicida]WAM43701.1 phage tail tape measure protein [Edwardsiella piscicida]